MPVSKHRRRRGRVAPGSRGSAASLALSRPRKRKTNWLYVAASGLIAVLVIGGFAIGSAGFGQSRGIRGGSSDVYVDGVGVQQEIMPTTNHVEEGSQVVYGTISPASGDHYAQWSQCGFFEHTLANERIVHNLEHGNIVVSYNLTSVQEVEQLRRVVDDIGPATIWGVTRAYDKIPEGTVTLAAWGVLDTMQGIDQQRVETFFDTYAGNLGPEKVTCTQGGVMDPPPGESGS